MIKHILVWKNTCCYRHSHVDSHYTLLKMRRRQKGKLVSKTFSLSAPVQPMWPPAQSWGASGRWVNKHNCIMPSSHLCFLLHEHRILPGFSGVGSKGRGRY